VRGRGTRSLARAVGGRFSRARIARSISLSAGRAALPGQLPDQGNDPVGEGALIFEAVPGGERPEDLSDHLL
jgi:hypothetical protein